MPPAVGDIKAAYESHVEARREYLDWAQEAADLTITSLRPKGLKVETRPWTQLGVQAVRSLGATMHRITMPPQVKWLKLDIEPSIRATVPEDLIIEDAVGQPVPALMKLDTDLSHVEDSLLTTLSLMQARSRTASAMQRNLVEGTTGVAVFEDSLHFIPLRNLIVFREGGTVVFWIFREEFSEDAFTASPTRNETERKYIYTLVDYESEQVWQQQENGTPERVKADVKQFFVMVGNTPDIDHYPTSYVYDHLGLINELNHMSERLGEAMATAAWNLPIIRPGSTLTQSELENHPSGKPLIVDPEDLSWFSAGIKFGDWQHVKAYRESLREELSQLFALGIKDRVAKAATATEILQIAGELETHTQDLLSGYEETFQRPLVEATMVVSGLSRLAVPGLEKAIRVLITTGQNALQRESSFTRMVNTASVVKSLDPFLGVDGLKVMEAAGAAQQFETKGFFFRNEPQPDAGGDTIPDGASGVGGPQPGSPDEAATPPAAPLSAA